MAAIRFFDAKLQQLESAPNPDLVASNRTERAFGAFTAERDGQSGEGE